MEEKSTQHPGASDVETPEEKASDNHYELDLEEHVPTDIDEVFKDAVAAVDRAKDGEHALDDDTTEPPSDTASDSSVGVSPDPQPADKASAGEDAAERAKEESEATGLRERLMRTLADFDNYRKRTEREKQSLRRFANFDVFKDFLGVLDNLERAMDSSGTAEDLKQGLKMIVRQHEEILRRHGVERVDAVGKTFDPTVHEAVAREESAEIEVPTVTQEMQRGYLLHDRLLRPAMVFVAMPGGGPSDDGKNGDGRNSS